MFFSLIQVSLSASPALCQTGLEGTDLARLEEIARYSSKPADAVNALQTILQKDPRNSRAHFLLGLVLERCGFADLADQEFEKAEKLDPGSALRVFASRWQNAGQPAAVRFLSYFESHYPDDPSVLLMRAAAAERLGNDASAERIYKEAMARFGNTPGIASSFAEFRLKQQRSEEAIELADHDLALKKDHVAASLSKAEALINQRKYLPALPLIQRVYDCAADSSDKQRAAELLFMLYRRQGMFVAALEPAFYLLALLPEKDYQQRAFNLALRELIRQNSDRSLAVAAHLVAKQLKDPDRQNRLLLRLSDNLAENGRRSLAFSLCEESSHLSTGAPLPLPQLASLKGAQGDFVGAEALLRWTSSALPQDSSIKAAYLRWRSRFENRQRDLSWQLKKTLFVR